MQRQNCLRAWGGSSKKGRLMKINVQKNWGKKRFIRFKSIKLFCQIRVGEIFLCKLLDLKCGVGIKCTVFQLIFKDCYLNKNFAANIIPPGLVQVFILFAHLPCLQMFCTFSKCVLILQAFLSCRWLMHLHKINDRRIYFPFLFRILVRNFAFFCLLMHYYTIKQNLFSFLPCKGNVSPEVW